ncbi:MAG TPA: hypothetical protein VFS43_08740 [Polyangiaceae bacterium]|nr:hypothetical protein [Polyangiaceae bacterium]
MAYRFYIREHLFVVRWQSLTLEDLDRVATQARLIRVQQRRDIIYAGLQGDGLAEPDADVRKGLVPRAVAIAKTSKHYHLVIDATGMRASVHRSIIRGLMGVARALQFEEVRKARLFESVRDMLEFDPDDLPASIDTLLREMDAAGVLSPEPDRALARQATRPYAVVTERPAAPDDATPGPGAPPDAPRGAGQEPRSGA